jgi:hypothetical protein
MRSASTRAFAPVRTALATALFAVLLFTPPGAWAQGICTRNGQGTCVIGDDATHAIRITITQAIRLESSSGAVSLATPTGLDYDAGFGLTVGPSLTMKANVPWTVTLRATQALWTASPAPARANKPVTDLQWGVAAVGPFADLTTSTTTIATGAAGTNGTLIPLHFRVKYAWTLDTPGTYSIPLQLTVTAP